MGLYTIDCPECKKPHQWFSGNMPDQRCGGCKAKTQTGPRPIDCQCDAQYSGRDEAEYCARGCPSCICGSMEDGDIIHPMQPISFDEVMKRVEDDRSKNIIERTKRALLDDGLVDTPITEKSSTGMGDYPSFFDMMVDRKLEGLRAPSAEEVFADMKRQYNYAAKTIADAEKEYKKLFNKHFDLQQEYDRILKGRDE